MGSLGHNFTPPQTHKHEAASPLGSLCDSPYSFCWEPGAPAWQAWSCCCQTWTQTCWCQTCWCQTCRATEQQRKIVHLDMHLDSRMENLDPGRPDRTWPRVAGPAHQKHFQTYH